MRIPRVGQFNEKFLPNLLEIQLASYDDFLGRRFNIFWSLVGETETLHNFLYTLAKNYTLGIRVSKGTTKERAETANRILAEVRDRINPDAIKDEIPRPNYYYIILPKGNTPTRT